MIKSDNTESPAFHVSISDRSQRDRSMERCQRSISVVLSWSVCRARTQIDLKAIRPWKDERSIWETCRKRLFAKMSSAKKNDNLLL